MDARELVAAIREDHYPIRVLGYDTESCIICDYDWPCPAAIAADRIGRFSVMSRVTRVPMLTSVGRTSERAGCNSTSSNVSAESPVIEEMIFAKACPSVLQKTGSPRCDSVAPRVGEGQYHRPSALGSAQAASS